jgi:hypothetical protein
MDVTSSLTELRAMAVTSVVNLAPAGMRGVISATIGTALKGNIGGPLSDSAVLSAIGAACSRYSE